jgi:alpha,alpha-trehalose phosphorylase
MCFKLLFRGRRLRVEILPGEARYELLDGAPLDVLHHGTAVRLVAGAPATARPWSPPPADAAVAPPAGREPFRHGIGADC